MNDDDQALSRLPALDPTLTEGAPAKGSARYEQILNAALQIDPASDAALDGGEQPGGDIERRRGSLRRRPLVLVATVALLASLAALALLAGNRFTGLVGSSPASPAEKAARLVADLKAESATANLGSSNPYDYAENSAALQALVAIGTPALAAIDESITGASTDGLSTYLLAIAAERIAKVDLRADSPENPWDSGKAWIVAWHAHLRAIPKEVAAIAQSSENQDAKTADLVALGTPAIPFILDRVAAGDATLAPAATQLIHGTTEVEGVPVPSIVTASWAQAEVDRFAELRHLVMAQQ